MKTCVLLLEDIRSVENTGSIFRTADGLGVAKIFLIGTTPAPLDRFGRKRSDFAKVALGAEETVDWKYFKNIQEALSELKEMEFEIISLEQTDKSRELSEFVPKEQFALIVGNEVTGVSKEALENSNAVVEIKMHGAKESLNVSVATGIALHSLLS